MQNAKSILNMTVVNLADGERIGRVQDLIVDPGQRQVVALLLQPSGLSFFQSRRAVLYEGVRHIGADAVVVADKSFVVHTSRDQALRPFLSRNIVLVGKPVMAEGGRLLGVIADLLFDSETGRVHGYVLRSLYLKGFPRGFVPVLPADEVLVVGRHLAMVSTRAEFILQREVQQAKEAEREARRSRLGFAFWRRRRTPAADLAPHPTAAVAVAASISSGESEEAGVSSAGGSLAA